MQLTDLDFGTMRYVKGPEYVYMVMAATLRWGPLFYDLDNALNAATCVAVEQGFDKDLLYFDNDDGDFTLYSKTCDDAYIARVKCMLVDDAE